MMYDIAIFVVGLASGFSICRYLKWFATSPDTVLQDLLKNCVAHMDAFKNKSEVKIRRESQLLVDSLRGNKWLQ